MELPQSVVDTFRIAPCERCGSEYQKPDVVWFGGNVPPRVVAASRAMADSSTAALVLGSTLITYSAYRLVRAVSQRGHPVALVNLGDTRADELATVKVSASLQPTLSMLLEGLQGELGVQGREGLGQASRASTGQEAARMA